MLLLSTKGSAIYNTHFALASTSVFRVIPLNATLMILIVCRRGREQLRHAVVAIGSAYSHLGLRGSAVSVC